MLAVVALRPVTPCRMNLRWLAVAAVLGTASPVGAAAPPGSDVGVEVVLVPLDVQTGDAENARAELARAFEASLEQGPHTIVAAGQSPCDKECARQLVVDQGVEHLVRAQLRGQGRDYEFEAEILDRKGTVVATTSAACDTCGAAELAGFLTDQGVRLANKLGAFSSRPAVLVVDTDPSGALVRINGEVVGKTPLEYTATSGMKIVRVEMPGHVAAERKIELVDGVHERLTLSLDAQPEASRGRGARVLGAINVVAGLGLLGGGIAGLILDSDPVPRKCTGIDVDDDGDCKFLYDTRALGIGLTAGGAALTAVGVGLLVWDLSRRGSAPARGARLHVTPGGLALSGRF
jgi:hypothetical protein